MAGLAASRTQESPIKCQCHRLFQGVANTVSLCSFFFFTGSDNSLDVAKIKIRTNLHRAESSQQLHLE